MRRQPPTPPPTDPLPPADRRSPLVARLGGVALAGTISAALWSLGCSCFVGTTRIATPRGRRRIDELCVGDEVFAYDVEQGSIVVRPIIERMRATSTELLSVRAGELSIEGVTAEHPFWDTRSRTWVRAADLTLSHSLLAWLGSGTARELPVESLVRLRRSEPVTVHNLHVGGGSEHDFFAEGLLVHNKSPAFVSHDAAGDAPDASARSDPPDAGAR